MLIRFAGPRLAAANDDDLVPVRLRRGGRVLGGSLSWEQPQKLGSFSREGPFNDFAVPDDVTSRARCWPSRTDNCRNAPGRRWPTARRW